LDDLSSFTSEKEGLLLEPGARGGLASNSKSVKKNTKKLRRRTRRHPKEKSILKQIGVFIDWYLAITNELKHPVYLREDFHGMNKVLLLRIASDLAKKENVAFVDIDMGAAHSRIACYLNRGIGKLLEASLKNPDFWATQVKKVKPVFQKAGISLHDGEIKKILKVGLYTSLNGGNPSSDNRIMDNMTQNTGRYLKSKGIDEKDKKSRQSDSLFFAIRYAFERFALIQEVRDLKI
jgi:hypothetical protein